MKLQEIKTIAKKDGHLSRQYEEDRTHKGHSEGRW